MVIQKTHILNVYFMKQNTNILKVLRGVTCQKKSQNSNKKKTLKESVIGQKKIKRLFLFYVNYFVLPQSLLSFVVWHFYLSVS